MTSVQRVPEIWEPHPPRIKRKIKLLLRGVLGRCEGPWTLRTGRLRELAPPRATKSKPDVAPHGFKPFQNKLDWYIVTVLGLVRNLACLLVSLPALDNPSHAAPPLLQSTKAASPPRRLKLE